MTNRFFAAIAAATFVTAAFATPGIALAQSDAPSSASDMKGSPNAAGYGKERGMQTNAPASSATDKTGSDERPSAKDMKGSPNADGFKK